ncbi:MAG: hypothetical protein CMO78_03520 [Verrucomicrobiales bacterium]|nr:hypothetical protein [Verrucomicrobiales bacterium]
MPSIHPKFISHCIALPVEKAPHHMAAHFRRASSGQSLFRLANPRHDETAIIQSRDSRSRLIPRYGLVHPNNSTHSNTHRCVSTGKDPLAIPILIRAFPHDHYFPLSICGNRWSLLIPTSITVHLFNSGLITAHGIYYAHSDFAVIPCTRFPSHNGTAIRQQSNRWVALIGPLGITR